MVSYSTGFKAYESRCFQAVLEMDGVLGNMLHMIWSCPKFTSFWDIVHEVIQKCMGLILDSSPKFFLLQHNLFSIKKYNRSLVSSLVCAAPACMPCLNNIKSIQRPQRLDAGYLKLMILSQWKSHLSP